MMFWISELIKQIKWDFKVVIEQLKTIKIGTGR